MPKKTRTNNSTKTKKTKSSRKTASNRAVHHASRKHRRVASSESKVTLSDILPVYADRAKDDVVVHHVDLRRTSTRTRTRATAVTVVESLDKHQMRPVL